jgi:hypothetical protein
VRARVVPRFLWTTASIDVFLDGRCILKTDGQRKAVGSSFAEFHHGGDVHSAELSWGQACMRPPLCLTFPYQLFIDGGKISVSEVRVENPASAFNLIAIGALTSIIVILLPPLATFF